MLVGKRFDQDVLGEVFADAESGVAHLADDVGVRAEQADFSFFAKTQLSQAMGHLRGSLQLLDPDRRAGPDLGKRTDQRLLTTFRSRLWWHWFFHFGAK